MKTPVITVKKVQTFRGHEGIGVNADVYIDGVLCGYFHDGAYGGEPDFDFVYDEKDPTVRRKAQEKFDALEKYADGLPKVDLNADKSFGNDPLMQEQDAMSLIDDAINKTISDKEDKKKAGESLKGIMVGKPDGMSYRFINWKGKTVAQMCETAHGKMTVQVHLMKVKKELKNGEIILNADYLKTLGLTV